MLVGTIWISISDWTDSKGLKSLRLTKKKSLSMKLRIWFPVVILDSTDEKSMRSINIDYVDIAIVAIGSNVQSSLDHGVITTNGHSDIYVMLACCREVF